MRVLHHHLLLCQHSKALNSLTFPLLQAELSRERQPNAVDSSEGSWDQHAVQGTCNSLEKKYFRLTGPPDPSLVRPPHVLKAALERVVKMYRAGQCDMHYAEDQLKAMRQDVTVQHVEGQLPVQIYEAHARACLEHGNGADFNQCQTVLKVLYEGGSQGSVQEFVAYRVLYQSILRSKESASLLATLEHLSPQVSMLFMTSRYTALLFTNQNCHVYNASNVQWSVMTFLSCHDCSVADITISRGWSSIFYIYCPLLKGRLDLRTQSTCRGSLHCLTTTLLTASVTVCAFAINRRAAAISHHHVLLSQDTCRNVAT